MKTFTFLSALLCLLWFSSCLTVKKIERNCDKFAKICITGTKTETIYRDTTIFRTDTLRVPLPFRDTVKITDTVRVVNNVAYLPTVHRRFGLIGVDAGVQKSILSVSAYLTDSTILFPHRDTILIEKAIRDKTTTDTVDIREKYIPGFYKFTFWVFIVATIAGIGLVAWNRFFRKLSGKYFP